MTKSILSQLSIIMTSSFDIVSPPRIRGGIRQVSGGTTAGPRRIRGEIRVSRGGIESGQVRGSAGGLEKLSAGVSGLVKKPLECTVCKKKDTNQLRGNSAPDQRLRFCFIDIPSCFKIQRFKPVTILRSFTIICCLYLVNNVLI